MQSKKSTSKDKIRERQKNKSNRKRNPTPYGFV